MVSERKYKNITWINIENPQKDDLDHIQKEHGVHQLILKELELPSERSKAEIYDDHIYLILHFPKYNPTRDKKTSDEVDFVIGKDLLITAHYGTVNSIAEFEKIFEANSILHKIDFKNAGHIFVQLVKKLYEDIDAELSGAEHIIETIEADMFNMNGEYAIEKLSKINRELIDFKKTLNIHKDVLGSFERISGEFFGEKFSHHTALLLGNHDRLWNNLEGLKETVIDLRQTIDSLFSARTNSVIRTLTVLTFITIPLSIVANFGQNAENIPIIGHAYDFWIVLGLMIAIATALFLLFRSKKWL